LRGAYRYILVNYNRDVVVSNGNLRGAYR